MSNNAKKYHKFLYLTPFFIFAIILYLLYDPYLLFINLL